jgi:hypothetical protein
VNAEVALKFPVLRQSSAPHFIASFDSSDPPALKSGHLLRKGGHGLAQTVHEIAAAEPFCARLSMEGSCNIKSVRHVYLGSLNSYVGRRPQETMETR